MHFRNNILCLCLVVLCLSCVREDSSDCPAPGDIAVAVSDKNYANVSDIIGMTPISENLPLISYTYPVTVWWHMLNTPFSETKKVVLNNYDKVHELDLNNVSEGTYDILVIGNELMAERRYSTGLQELELHTSGLEDDDIYIGYARVTIPLGSDNTVKLYRTKGKLIVSLEDIPESMIRADVEVSGVYGKVNENFSYMGVTDVNKSFSLEEDNNEQSINYPVLEMMLAPTPSSATGKMSVTFTDKDDNEIRLSNIDVSIRRNEITLLRPGYDPDTGEWEVCLWIDGEWRRVHDMQVREN